MTDVKWNDPSSIPDVEKGTEKLFWVAAQSNNKTYVFAAHYQNRPLELDDDGAPRHDWVLDDVDGEPIHSVGWVDCKEHAEFSDFYSPLSFNDKWKMLGWAEYAPPKFTGVATNTAREGRCNGVSD